MKKSMSFKIIALIVCIYNYPILCLAENTAHSIMEKDLKTEQDKLNYAWGLEIGYRFKEYNFKYIPDAFIKGLMDGQADGPKLLGAQELHSLLTHFQMEAAQRHQERYAEISKENLDKGTAYLEENKKKKGVVVTDSGLQYRVLKTGNGIKPNQDDVLNINFVAKYVDGKEFDSTTKRNAPTKVTFQQIIPGWKEALSMMSPGAKWEIVVPPSLAYGMHGMGRVIPPNATLVFDLELLSAEKDTQQTAPAAKGDNARTN